MAKPVPDGTVPRTVPKRSVRRGHAAVDPQTGPTQGRSTPTATGLSRLLPTEGRVFDWLSFLGLGEPYTLYFAGIAVLLMALAALPTGVDERKSPTPPSADATAAATSARMFIRK